MDIPTHSQVVDQVEAFLKRHDIAESRFGRDVTGEPQLVATLRAGREPRRAMLEKIFAFMKAKDAEAGPGEVADHDDGDTAAADAASSGNGRRFSGSETNGLPA